MKGKNSEYKLLSGLFFKLLPYQVLLLIITAINGVVDSLYASNIIGKSAMSAIGLFGPLNHFLYAASIMFVSGSQILYGRYLARDRNRINHLFTVNLTISGALGLVTSALLTAGVFTGVSSLLVNTQPDLQMLNQYILGQVVGIPDRIGVGPEDRIDISVTSEEEVLDVSVQVGEFCLRHGIDARRSFFSSLCMEEMAGNIVRHGFPLDKKHHSADIRVVHKNDEIILRVRDNCSAFDPSEYHRVMQLDENGRNIGIRLVYGIANDVKYQNLLGMNVLTIRI